METKDFNELFVLRYYKKKDGNLIYYYKIQSEKNLKENMLLIFYNNSLYNIQNYVLKNQIDDAKKSTIISKEEFESVLKKAINELILNQ